MALLKPETYRRGGMTATTLNIGAQGLAFVFNLVMAACFGAIAATDVFNYCVTTFAMVTTFMLTLDSAVLIPEAMRRREQESPLAAIRFLNFFLYLFGGLTALFTLVTAVAPIRFLTLISRFDVAVLEANRTLILWVIPVFLLQLLVQYTNSILVSYRYFSLPAKWAVFSRILNIVFVVMFYKTLGVVALAQSLILGLSLQLGISLWLMRHQLDWSFSVRFPRIGAQVWRNIGYTELGILVVSMASFSPVLMASEELEGFVTAMNYALKLSLVPETVLSAQIVLIVGIKLNELMARRETEAFGQFYERSVRFMLWVCTPLAFLMYVLAPEALEILFLRGAYTREALAITVELFRGFIVALPAVVYNGWLLQALSARQQVLGRNVMDILMCLCIFAGLWVLVPRVGLLHYPWIKAACLYGVHFFWMLGTRRRMQPIRLGRVYGMLLVHVVINAGLAAGCLWVLRSMSVEAIWMRVAGGFAVYVIVWFVLQLILPWDRMALGYAKEFIRGWRTHRREGVAK